MVDHDVIRCTQCLNLLTDLGVTLSMDEIENKLCKRCNKNVSMFSPLNGFPVSQYMNEGDTALITVDSPDGDFMLALDKDGSVCLEVFDPVHRVHRGKVYHPQL